MRGLGSLAIIMSAVHFSSPLPCRGVRDRLCSLEASTALVCRASASCPLVPPPGRERAEE